MPRSHSRGILYTAPPGEDGERAEQTADPADEPTPDAAEPTPADD